MIQAAHRPKISILLPVYNAEKYLCECLDSILNQTLYEFEVIAINDASTDNSLLILEKYANKDSRIKVFSNSSNKKLAATLNKGIELATAPLIARMDADDISHSNRLEYQYNFMKVHPEIAICGTAVNVLGTNDIWAVPETDSMIRSMLVFNSPILHPTVIYRTAVIKRHLGYNVDIVYAQDYELWHRLSKDKSVTFSNINIPLLSYRLTDNDKPSSYKHIQRETAASIRKQQLQSLGIYPTKKQLMLHNLISYHQSFNRCSEIIAAYLWLRTIATSPRAPKDLTNLCWQYWKQICRTSSCKVVSYPLYTLLPSPQKLTIIKKYLSFQKVEKR